MRYRTKVVPQLLLFDDAPTEVLAPRAKRQKTRKLDWNADLHAVKADPSTFGVVTKRHGGLIRLLVRKWVSRCTASIDEDDLMQETLAAIWKAINEFDAERGVRLDAFVRVSVGHHLHQFTAKHIKRYEKDAKYWEQQIVDEKVIYAPGARAQMEVLGGSYVAVAAPVRDDLIDVVKLTTRTIGSLSSKSGRVVAAIVNGQDPEVEAELIYGSVGRKRKAWLRSIREATDVVETFRAEVDGHEIEIANDNQDQEANDNSCSLKPTRKVQRCVDAGERVEGSRAC
jgi:hypothetical protein